MLAKKGVRFPTHKQHSTLLFAPNTSQKDSAFPNLREAFRILCSSSTTMLWSKQSWVTNALHRKVLFHDFIYWFSFSLRRRSRSNYFRASLVRALVSRDIQASFPLEDDYISSIWMTCFLKRRREHSIASLARQIHRCLSAPYCNC